MITGAHFIQLTFIAGLVLLLIPVMRLGAYVLGLPLRRRENSRLFLDLLAMGLREGRRAEDVFLSLARTGDRTLEFLCVPRTPRVLGTVHIFLGAVGLLIALISLAIHLKDIPIGSVDALMDALVALHLIVWAIIMSSFYIWAGVQLVRYRTSGRWLAIGLAAVNILLVSASLASLVFAGALEGVVLTVLGYVPPMVFIYLLIHPEVAAVCGRDGKQSPLLVVQLREMELVAALRKVPGLIEPRIVSLLSVGRELGDLQKVLPACRSVLGEATGKVRASQNYFVTVALVMMPASLVLLPILGLYIFPKFQLIISDMISEAGMAGNSVALFVWLDENFWLLVGGHGLVMLSLWAFALAFLAGPRLQQIFARTVPGLCARLALALPWRRKRAQRDFSISLALLLDAGLPEARAVELAAESTDNRIFQIRAALAIDDLANGVPLPEALRRIDGSGEFQWRLTTAARAGQGFLPALRAWHESLDARADQQEQAAAQVATTGLVFYNGAIVGLVMLSVFQFLIGVLDATTLW
jgi:type II secretory pathway component PulF